MDIGSRPKLFIAGKLRNDNLQIQKNVVISANTLNENTVMVNENTVMVKRTNEPKPLKNFEQERVKM